jgi:hypothetical protein
MRRFFLLLAGTWALALACKKAPPPAQQTPPPAREQTTFLVLAFPGEDLLLHRETREVPELPPTPEAQAKVVLQELLAGPRGPFAPVAWWPAEVQEVFHDGQGVFFVNLAPAPPSTVGSEGELALQAAVATTLALNLKQVKAVQLLFEGKEVATLGHLDFAHPTAPRWELLAP